MTQPLASRVCPELPVADVAAAADWYRNVLGAVPVWTWLSEFGAVRIGDAELYLVRTPARRPISCYLHVPDVDAVHTHAVSVLGSDASPGGAVEEALADREWAMREFVLRDPWGNRLRVGQPLRLVQETPGYVPHMDDPRVP